MYNFEAAIKAGTTPQQITNYLTSQGRQKEAEEHFGKIQQPQKSGLGQQIGEAFKSGLNQAKSGFEQVNTGTGNPLDLISGAGKIGAGVINTALSPLAPVTNKIGEGLNAATQPLQNNPTVQNFANSKAGQVTSRVAEDIGNYANIAGAVGGAMEVPKVTSAVTGTAKKAIQSTADIAGQGLKNAGEGAYGLTITPQESTARAMVNADAGLGAKPITEANTAARKGLVGTEYKLGVQAKKISSDLWKNDLQPKLAAVKSKVDMKSFLGEIEKDIKKTADPTRRNDLTEALNKVKEDYNPVNKVSLKKLQDYKAGWAEFVPESSYNGKPIGSSLKAVHDLMAEKAREVIYKNIGQEGKQAYLDYGNLQSIIKSGVKSITGDPAAKSLSKNVWELLMNKGITPTVTGVGKILYKTGEAISKKPKNAP